MCLCVTVRNQPLSRPECHQTPPPCISGVLRWYHTCSRHTNCSQGVTRWPPSLTTTQLHQCSVHPLSVAVMKTASRAQPRSSPPLVQMRRYTPGVYPFLFPSVISSLPQLPPPSPQRLQIQQPSSSTPSPVGEY